MGLGGRYQLTMNFSLNLILQLLLVVNSGTLTYMFTLLEDGRIMNFQLDHKHMRDIT